MDHDDTRDEEAWESFHRRLDEILNQIENANGSPTKDDVMRDIKRVQAINGFDLMGVVHASTPCCIHTKETDVIAVFIHSEESQQKINERHDDFARFTPEFKTVVFVCYDMHRWQRTMIVQDVESIMQLQNILGSAIQRLQERDGPNPLDKLLVP
jgi:hypothetical protein